MAIHLLLGNALYRCLVVETEVASVDDVVGLCVARELIELAQVSSNVCYAKHTSMTDLLHSALVRVERPGPGDRT